MKKVIFGIIAIVIIIVLLVIVLPSGSKSPSKVFLDQMLSEFMVEYDLKTIEKEIAFPRTETDQGLSNMKVLTGYAFNYEGAPVFNDYMKSIIGNSPEWLNSVWQKGFINDKIVCLQSDGSTNPKGPAEVFCADLPQP